MDRRDPDGRLEPDGGLVTASGVRPVPLETADLPLDRVADLVGPGSRGRAATGPAAALAIADLVGRLGDRAPDFAPAQVGTIRAGGVRPVAAHPQRSVSWPFRTGRGHPDRVQDRLEPLAVTSPPCGDQ